MPIDNFGIKLKEFRIRKGLTQKELSKKLFVSRKSVSKWETGRGMPDTAMIPKIAAALGVGIDELFEEKTKTDDYYSQLHKSVDETVLYMENYRRQKKLLRFWKILAALLSAVILTLGITSAYFYNAYTNSLLHCKYTLLYKDYAKKDSEWVELTFSSKEFDDTRTDLATIETDCGAVCLVALKQTVYAADGSVSKEKFYSYSHQAATGANKFGPVSEGLPSEYLIEGIPQLNKSKGYMDGGNVVCCRSAGVHRIEFQTERGDYVACVRVKIPEDKRTWLEMCFFTDQGDSLSANPLREYEALYSRPLPVLRGQEFFGKLAFYDWAGNERKEIFSIEKKDELFKALDCGGRIIISYKTYYGEWQQYFYSWKNLVYEVRIDLIGSTKYKDIFMNFDFYALSS